MIDIFRTDYEYFFDYLSSCKYLINFGYTDKLVDMSLVRMQQLLLYSSKKIKMYLCLTNALHEFIHLCSVFMFASMYMLFFHL